MTVTGASKAVSPVPMCHHLVYLYHKARKQTSKMNMMEVWRDHLLLLHHINVLDRISESVPFKDDVTKNGREIKGNVTDKQN